MISLGIFIVGVTNLAVGLLATFTANKPNAGYIGMGVALAGAAIAIAGGVTRWPLLG